MFLFHLPAGCVWREAGQNAAGLQLSQALIWYCQPEGGLLLMLLLHGKVCCVAGQLLLSSGVSKGASTSQFKPTHGIANFDFGCVIDIAARVFPSVSAAAEPGEQKTGQGGGLACWLGWEGCRRA